MHFEFFLEEPSAEAALTILIPKIVGADIPFRLHVFQGKKQLLDRLGNRLRAYARWVPADWRLIVLIDEDRQNCHDLKHELEDICTDAGLTTKSEAKPHEPFQILNRIAVEELEAWFFGDVQAICAAYPGVPETLGNRARFRIPDAIGGGTWEALEEVLQKAGYHQGGLAKIAAARNIASQMDPLRNISASFRVFRDGLLAALG